MKKIYNLRKDPGREQILFYTAVSMHGRISGRLPALCYALFAIFRKNIVHYIARF